MSPAASGPAADAFAAETSSSPSAAESRPPAPRASRALWAAMGILCVAGLGVAIELTALHVRVHHDPAYRSFCAISERVNCDAVAQSKYAVVLGLPVSVWGIFGYVAMAAVAALGLARRPRAGLMLALAAGSSFVSAGLGTISVLRISSVCLLCLTTYAINFVLFALAWIAARRQGVVAAVAGDVRALASGWRLSGGIAAVAVAVVAVTTVAVPAYWKPTERHGAEGLPHGVTVDGHAWIGAQTDPPKVLIVEYTDYECPHCRRTHDQLRNLVAAHPQEVRIIHKHFPLDSTCNRTVSRPFHANACRFAAMAWCAGEQEKFWEANDYLYANGTVPEAVEMGAFASAVGLEREAFEQCVREGARPHIEADVQDGIVDKVEGTPSLIVDGRMYHQLPDEVLARLR